MNKIELTSNGGKVYVEIPDGAKKELDKSGIDVEKEMQSIIRHEEDERLRLGKRDHVTRMEYNLMRFFLTAVVLATALLAWRISSRNNENICNIAKICDKVGIEYSISTNHIGLRNNIILK